MRDQLSAGLSAATNNANKSLSGLTKNMGAMVNIGATIGTAIGAQAVNAFANFEQRMSAVGAVSGATGAQMEQLTGLAKQFGAETQFSAQESAMALEELAKAGLPIPDILNGAAKSAVDLAAAGELGMGQAAEIASAAKNNFGLAATEMSRVADLAAGAANASATDVAGWGESIKAVGPTARTVGLDIQETTKWISALARAGVTGSLAGNSMKRALLQLAAPTSEASALMQELGFSAFDSSGKIKPVAQLAGELQTALKDLNPQAQAEAMQTMFGSFGLQAGSALMQQGAQGINDISKALSGVSAAEVAAAKMDNFAGSVEQLRGSLETLMINVGEPLVTAFRPFVDLATQIINALLPLSTALMNLPQPIIVLVGTMAPLISMFAMLKGATAILPASLEPALSALTKFSTPISLLIPLAAALFVAYKTNFLGLRDAVEPVITAISAKLQQAKQVWDTFMQGFNFAGGFANPFAAIEQGLNAILGRFPELATAVSGAKTVLAGVQVAVDLVKNSLMAFGTFLMQHKEVLIGVGAAWVTFKAGMMIGGLVSQVQAGFTTIVTGLRTMMVTMQTGAITAKGLWTAIGGPLGLLAIAIGVFAAAWAGNWGGIREKTASAIAFIKTHLNTIKTALSILSPPILLLRLLFAGSFQEMANIMSNVGNTIGNIITTIATKLGMPASQVQALRAGWNSAWQSITTSTISFITAILSKLGPLIDGIASLAGMIGIELGGSAVGGIQQSEAAIARGAQGMAQRASDAAEQEFIGGRQRVAQGAKAMVSAADDAIKQKSIDAAGAAKAAGEGVAEGMAEGLGGGGAGGEGGGGGEGKNPVDAAMQTISAVSQAVTAGLDAAEKMFTFRGSPPADLMDEVFAMLKDMADRAIDLASDIGPEIAEQAGKAWQMLSTVTQTLQGMVDLGEKLARFRVPTVENMSQLKLMAQRIAEIALDITDMFLSGDLQSNLEDLAIGQKVAENLKAWVDLLKGMAEATGAIAKARLDVDMSGVFAFIRKLVDMSLTLTQELKARLGSKLRVLLADTKDVADTLKPWAELLKMMGEVTKSLAQSRFPADLSAPEKFLHQLASVMVSMVEGMRRTLGPTILIALEDGREIAETLKPYAEILKDIGAVTESIARSRTNVPLDGVLTFLGGLLDVMLTLRQTVLSRLSGTLLVALEDSREIANTFKDWLEPIKSLGAVAESIDQLRKITAARSDTTFTALADMLLAIGSVTGGIVSRAWSELGTNLLVALEDSRDVAETFKAWMEPLAKVGEVALAIDTLRSLTQQRFDTGYKQLADFLYGIASATGGILAQAWTVVGHELLVQLQNSREVAETFKAWLEPLAKVGEVATSIDKLRALSQQRFDTSMTALIAFLFDIAAGTAKMVDGASRGADPAGRLAVSKAIAETFGPWLDVVLKSKDAAEAILRMPTSLSEDAFAAVEKLLVSISQRTAAMVKAVARDADPTTLLGVSKTVAETFGAWLDIMARVGDATESLANMVDVPDDVLNSAIDILVTIASRTSKFVAAVARDADPQGLLAVSKSVAETFGAWLDVMSKAAHFTQDLVAAEGVDMSKVDALDVLLSDMFVRLKELAKPITDMEGVARELFIPAVKQYLEVMGGAVGLFSDMAGLTKELAEVVPVQDSDLNIVENALRKILDKVKVMASDFMPDANREAEKLVTEIKAYVEVAGAAVGLFSDAASIGQDTAEALAINETALANVQQSIARVMAIIAPMAETWAGAQENMTQTVANAKAFAETAGAALSVVSDAAETIRTLAEGDIGTIAEGALGKVNRAIEQVMMMIEALTIGFLDAKGKIDEARMTAIKSFSESAGSAISAVSETVGLLKSLTEEQGMLGGLTNSAKGLIKRAIVSVVGMMQEISLGFGMATYESRRAIERTAEFSDHVGDIMGAAGATLNVIKSAAEFFASEAGAKASEKGFAERIRAMMTEQITMMVDTLDQVLTDLGPTVLANAAAVAEKVGPIAENLGKMVEPIQKLLENPFASSSKRAAMAKTSSQFGGLVKGDVLGRRLADGLRKMVGAVLAGLDGIQVPSTVPAGLVALMDLVASVVAIVTEAMALPEIDFGRIADVRKAAEILAGTQIGNAIGFSGGGGGGGGGAGGGTSGGPYVISNSTFMGQLIMQGATVNNTMQLDGQTLQAIQRTESFVLGDSRASQQHPGV